MRFGLKTSGGGDTWPAEAGPDANPLATKARPAAITAAGKDLDNENMAQLVTYG